MLIYEPFIVISQLFLECLNQVLSQLLSKFASDNKQKQWYRCCPILTVEAAKVFNTNNTQVHFLNRFYCILAHYMCINVNNYNYAVYASRLLTPLFVNGSCVITLRSVFVQGIWSIGHLYLIAD